MLGDSFQQSNGLMGVARFQGMAQAHRAAPDRVFDLSNPQHAAIAGGHAIAVAYDLGVIVASVYVQQDETYLLRMERLVGQM